jgi:hypothetical protein
MALAPFPGAVDFVVDWQLDTESADEIALDPTGDVSVVGFAGERHRSPPATGCARFRSGWMISIGGHCR